MSNASESFLPSLLWGRKENEKTGNDLFESFWKDYTKSYSPQIEDIKHWDISRNDLLTKQAKISKEIREFHEEVRKISFSVILYSWLKGMRPDPVLARYYIEGMNKILERGLFILVSDGKEKRIGDFDSTEHLTILEIREKSGQTERKESS